MTITLDRIYEKLEVIEKTNAEMVTQLKVQAENDVNLERRVDRLERHEWWLITTVIGTVIVGIIGVFTRIGGG